MSMRRGWLLGALALSGACGDEAGGGGTVLAGSYAGSLSPRGTCTDGSMVPSAAIAADVTLFQVGNRVASPRSDRRSTSTTEPSSPKPSRRHPLRRRTPR